MTTAPYSPPVANRGRRLARPKVAASYLQIGLSTLWAYNSKMHDFPKPTRIGQRCTLFDLDELDSWLARQGGEVA